MDEWRLIYQDCDPHGEGVREVLCTLGNGYLATRGATCEAVADGVHYPATYLAGGYNRLYTEIDGKLLTNEDLVNWPNWLPVSVRPEGGDWLDPLQVERLECRHELDMREGVLYRLVRWRDAAGRVTRMKTRRLVSMRNPHLAALEVTVTPENWSGTIEIRSALDGRVVNANARSLRFFKNKHLEPLDSRSLDQETMYLEVCTVDSRVGMAQTARTRVSVNGQVSGAERRSVAEPGYVAQEASVPLSEGEVLTIEKVVAIYTSRDRAIYEYGQASRRALEYAGGFDELLAAHAAMWNVLWRSFDVRVELEPARAHEYPYVQMLLRLHTFHLLQTVSPASIDMDIGVPARGWHGEGYQGHIFWDDMFIFPFLNLRMPGITRALLLYRYRRLEEARRLAQDAGYQGVMFPWQSASSGEEQTPMLYPLMSGGEVKQWFEDTSHLQRHVTASVAYNLWRYYQVTQDIEFLSFYGAEMLFEIARFWTSVVEFNPGEGRYEIRDVVGPDEYHDAYPGANKLGLNNNSYTNFMAVWSLRCALGALDVLPSERRSHLLFLLGVSDEEIARWDEVSRKLKIVFHDGDIISQFEGYEQLKELDLEAYAKKHGNIQRLDTILRLEGQSPNDFQIAKQADVLMLFYLFSAEELQEVFERLDYPFHPESIPRNIEYYLKRVVHGSTLSRIAHAWVLARMNRADSWRLFADALISDFSDIQGGTTTEGIHLGAMSGTIDIIQGCYTGLITRKDVLVLNPVLPDLVRRLQLRIRYQGHTLDLDITQETICVSSRPSCAQPITIQVKDWSRVLHPGEQCEYRLSAEVAPGALRM